MDYSGSNSLKNLQGLTKEIYSDNKKKRFKKIINKIKGKSNAK